MLVRVESFVQRRDWQQFHNPKDLASAIAIEAAELMELFLWKSPAEVADLAGATQPAGPLREELADILILCCCLANRLNIDVSEAMADKLRLNDAKYPADVVRGRADKYTHYMSGEGAGVTDSPDERDSS